MSTPTGSLMVLDAGDVLAAAQHFRNAYQRRDVAALTDTDVRRARSMLAAARGVIDAIIPRLERELDYTRALLPDTPTETEPPCTDDSSSGSP